MPARGPPILLLPPLLLGTAKRRRRRRWRHQMLHRNRVRGARLGRSEEGRGRRRHVLAPPRRQQHRRARRPPRPSAVLLRPPLPLDHHRAGGSGKAAADQKHASISRSLFFSPTFYANLRSRGKLRRRGLWRESLCPVHRHSPQSLVPSCCGSPHTRLSPIFPPKSESDSADGLGNYLRRL